VADLQEQLQAILGDPQAMGQIAAIAQALTGRQEAPPAAQQAPAPQGDFVPVDAPAPALQGPVQDQIPDLGALLGPLEGLDPRLIQIALRSFTEYSAKDDEKAALLAALKPFLKPERQEKMEKAISIARLSRVVRVAIELLKEEGNGHV